MALALGSYFSQGANVLTYLLAARALGPAAFGPLSGAIGVAIVIASFGDFGINGWTIRALAQSPSSTELFRQTLSAKLMLATLLALAWAAISFITLDSSSLRLPVALLAGYLLSLIVAGTLTVPFRASEHMTVVGVVGAVEKAVALGVWLALQPFGGPRPQILAIALVAGGAASVLCAAVFIPRHLLLIAAPSLRQVLNLWRSSYSFGMVGVSAQIQRADTAIVSGIAGPLAAGVYAAPARLASFLSVIPASFSVAIFPRMARTSRDNTSRRPELLSTVAMVVTMVFLLAVFAVAAPLAVSLALGNAYLASVEVFRIYLLVVLVNAANQPLLAFLQAEGQERYTGRTMVAAAIVGLLAIAAGAYLGGAAGAAVGALVLQLLQLTLFASKALLGHGRLIPTHPIADSSDSGLETHLFPAEVSDDLPTL